MLRRSAVAWCFGIVAVAVFCSAAATPAARAACAPDDPHPVTSGTGVSGPPVAFSFRGGEIRAVFFLLGAGDAHHSGTVPGPAWVKPIGDLDGDGAMEYRLDAPGAGSGGWSDPRAAGCPSIADPPRPPLALLLFQARQDHDGDGRFDVFEDRNHNGVLEPWEDLDRDGRLTPRVIPGVGFGCESEAREDVDCDGRVDLINEDLNGNGRLDPGEDLDGDGRFDNINEDRNGNGVLEPGEDSNSNGLLDGVGSYIEDRNGNRFFDDRPVVFLDDMLDGPLPPDLVFPHPTGVYPYGALVPAPGGLVVASVDWNGAAYDFDAIDTPARMVDAADGRRWRVIDAQPLEAFRPRLGAYRAGADRSSYRAHIGLGRTRRVDDAGGARAVVDGFLVTLESAPFEAPLAFLESGTPEMRLPEGGGSLTITSASPGFPPQGGSLTVRLLSRGSETLLAPFRLVGSGPLLDSDRDLFALPHDNCPEVYNPSQLDADRNGLGDLCDAASDPGADVPDAWFDRTAPSDPGVRFSAAAAYDESRGVTVLFGGPDASTWEFDGASWTRVEATTVPPPRFGHRMVYDDVRRRVLMYGGKWLAGGTPVTHNDLWAYDGSDWRLIPTRTAPAPRAWGSIAPGDPPTFGLAFDSARDRLVLFGGESRGRTWVFESGDWRVLLTPRSPSPRHSAHLAYDRARQVVVLQGGYGAAGLYPTPPEARIVHTDTWELDGQDWNEVDAPGDLPPAWLGEAVYDPDRRRVVVVGGVFERRVAPPGPILDETWAGTRLFDGARWRLLATRPTIVPQAGHAAAWDGRRGVLVVHGADRPPGETGFRGRTWELLSSGDDDGDGVRNVDDVCPDAADPGQQDADGDGVGDVCDNCPLAANATRHDRDRDGTGDVCDADRDGDGVPNGADACPDAFVAGRPLQSVLGGGGPDSDGDGTPDDCDRCPHDPGDDADDDGFCADADNCPARFNPLQEDANGDGSGDACQPVLVIHGILEDGGEILEVEVTAGDPEGEPLSGALRFTSRETIAVPAVDLAQPRCEGYSPDGANGEGIAYFPGDGAGSPVLFDLDWGLAGATGLICSDGGQDFEISPGACAASAAFSPILQVSPPPSPDGAICVRRVGATGGVDLVIRSVGPERVLLERSHPEPDLVTSYSGGLPAEIDIAALRSDVMYRLEATATDGNTLPVVAVATFLHQAERLLRFQPRRPTAVIGAAAQAECDTPGGARVVLDGSESTDAAGGTTGLRFEWFENFGGPGERLLGTDPILETALALGTNRISLRVTDPSGGTDVDEATVTVVDTRPPVLTVASLPAVLWPPNHRLVPVRLSWTVSDACDPEPRVALAGAGSSEPDDAPGPDDGRTAGDIQGADIGTADADVLLRAERSGSGGGRLYTLVYEVRDASGNGDAGAVVIEVPHDLGTGPEPVDLAVGPGDAAGSTRLSWTVVADATAYDVVAGDLATASRDGGGRTTVLTRTIATGIRDTAWVEPPDAPAPPPGGAWFYLVQYHDTRGPSGFGTATAPWPLEVSSCAGDCAAPAVSGGDGSRAR
jgi:hypothetical protein